MSQGSYLDWHPASQRTGICPPRLNFSFPLSYREHWTGLSIRYCNAESLHMSTDRAHTRSTADKRVTTYQLFVSQEWQRCSGKERGKKIRGEIALLWCMFMIFEAMQLFKFIKVCDQSFPLEHSQTKFNNVFVWWHVIEKCNEETVTWETSNNNIYSVSWCFDRYIFDLCMFSLLFLMHPPIMSQNLHKNKE